MPRGGCLRPYICGMEIILDNGHGRDTAGKRSPDGRLTEWEYTRGLAREISKGLAERGLHTTLLVPEDCDIAIGERIRRANAIYAGRRDAVLVSLHVNAAGNAGWRSARGFCAYVAERASARSVELARKLMTAAKGLPGNRVVPREGFYRARFALLTRTECPAVLTENMFMDNAHDLAFLLSAAGFRRLVDVHVKALSAL